MKEDMSERSEEDRVVKLDLKSKKHLFCKFAFVLLIVAIIVLGTYTRSLKNQLRGEVSKHQDEIASLEKELGQERGAEDDHMENEKKEINYFVEDILPNFRQDNSIRAEEITKIFPLTLKKYVDDPRGWLVETRSDNSLPSHYLLTSTVQKKLENSMTDSMGNASNCELIDVITVGNESDRGRDLVKEGGYIILSSSYCVSYGGGSSVAIFSLETGEKIMITGEDPNSVIGNSLQRGTTESGNAKGVLRGVYGINNPVVVVEYGSFELAATKLEEIRAVAYIDLQTGRTLKTNFFN